MCLLLTHYLSSERVGAATVCDKPSAQETIHCERPMGLPPRPFSSPNRWVLELLSGKQWVLPVNLTLSLPLLRFISSEGSRQGCV